MNTGGEINLATICLRIGLALLMGGLLGIERERKNRPAGFRTYMLVCLGSALIMMINQYIYQFDATIDPVRMGAQVVSGIGFLGAGTILVTGRNQVKGVTTAAGLWTAAAIGLAIGIGFYEGAIVGCAAILLVMAAMQTLDRFVHSRNKNIELYIEFNNIAPFSDFMNYARCKEFEISNLQLCKEGDVTAFCAVLTAKSRINRTHAEMAEVLGTAPGVGFIEEI